MTYGGEFQALDETTKITTVGSFADNVQNHFFFADFHMSYDPCLCLFESKMEVRFEPKNIGDLTAWGVSAEPTTENLDLLASVWDEADGITPNGRTLKSNLFRYKDRDALVAGLKKIIDNSEYSASVKARDKQFMEFLKLGLEALKEEVSGGGTGEAAFKMAGNEKLSEPIKALAKYTANLFLPIGSEDSKVAPNLMAISGTVTTNYTGTKTIINTPGSKNAGNVCEEFPLNGYNAPIYDEALGIFALLETPKVMVQDLHIPGPPNPDPEISSGQTRQVGFKFNLESLKYALNPAAPVKSYEIKIAYEIKQKIPKCSQWPFLDEVYQLELLKSDQIFDLITQEGCAEMMQGPNAYSKERVFISPFMASECFSAFVPQFRRSTVSYVPINDQFEVKLHITVYLEHDQLNTEGKSIKTIFMGTYPVNIIPATENIIQPMPVNPQAYTYDIEGRIKIPSILDVPATTFSYDQGNFFLTIPGFTEQLTSYDANFYGSDEVNILGNIIVEPEVANHGMNFTYNAGRKVTVKPGSKITSPVKLKKKTLYGPCEPRKYQTSPSELASFCNGTSYMAKIFTREAVASNSNLLPKPSSSTYLSYPIPNPTRGECSLSFNLAEESGYSIQLSNILGETVRVLAKSEFSKTGQQSVIFDTGELEAGVYFITLSADGFRQARKLVVVK